MRIGFLNNQVDNRGTGQALFDYAHYNETILGNKSIVMSQTLYGRNAYMEKRLLKRFGKIYQPFGYKGDLDAIYHIHAGHVDGTSFRMGTLPYLVHAVFYTSEPHGTRFATVSEWLAGGKLPFVPHIVNKYDHPTQNWRNKYLIPDHAIVLGRYGGYDTFDIPWVWNAIQTVLAVRSDVYFVFANTAPLIPHERIIHMPELRDGVEKSNFLAMCDYMLHARERGETFGLSVGEFAVLGKPILTYRDSAERSHLEELGKLAWLYSNYEELVGLLSVVAKGWQAAAYTQYTPENVMRQFKEVFLNW